jgi:perosamine synthetase
MIPWAKPSFFGKEKEYVIEALESSWISGGPFVKKLELFFQEKTGLFSCAVSNGTVALHLAYIAQRGDEILVPA